MDRKGFTLIELIIVIAVIAVLAASVFVALDPARRFADFRNTQRRSDVRAILDALVMYKVDNEGDIMVGIDTNLRMLGLDSSGCDVECGASGAEGSGDTNHALNKTSTASSSYSGSYGSSNANDGNNNNFWLNHYSGGADGEWWQVDLGQEYKVNKVEVRWYNSSGSYNCNDFTIRGSNNGTDFTIVHGPIDTSGHSQDSTYTFDSASYRYWRFVCDDAVSSTFYILREMRVFEATVLSETTESSCLDISADIGSYLGIIPADPEVGGSGKTHYAVKLLSPSGIEVVSCSSENGEIIEISR